MDSPTQKPAPNHIQSAIDAGRELAPKVIASPIQDGMPFVVLRDADGGESVHGITDRFAAPPRKIGTVKMGDAASFVKYWEIHREDSSVIYADIAKPGFTALFDEHEKHAPKYRSHRATFSPQFSPEYKEWIAKNRQPFAGNEELALWIEDQLPDFVTPGGAAMLQMALNFKVVQNASFGKAIRLKDGRTVFSYTNDVQGSSDHESGSVQIPDQFEIAIPVYAGLNVSNHQFLARFRYRLNGGKLTLWYELIRPHKVIESAYGGMVAEIEKGSGVVVMFGSPD